MESTELMQAGPWQSSCPSARLIMQERHSRPPFILPGGEAVPACSPYHMTSAPPSVLLPSLSYSTGGAVDGPGVGVRGGLQLLAVRGNTTAHCVAFFSLSFLLVVFFFALPSSLAVK